MDETISVADLQIKAIKTRLRELEREKRVLKQELIKLKLKDEVERNE